jgi:hypothetical protein
MNVTVDDGPAIIMLALITSIVLVPLLCLMIQRAYRRAVQCSMQRAANEASLAPPPPPWRGGPTESSSGNAAAKNPPPVAGKVRISWTVLDHNSAEPPSEAARVLRDTARRMRRRSALVAVIGATGFAAVVASAALGSYGTGFAPVRWTVVAMLFAWPVVPVLAHVLGWSLRSTAIVVAVYVTVATALAASVGGGVRDVALLFAIFVILSGLLLLAFSHRALRAFAPYIAPSVLIATTAVMVAPFSLWRSATVAAGSFELGVALVLLVAGALGVIASYLLLRWIALLYQRRRTSERGLLIALWWLLCAVFVGGFLAMEGPLWGLLPLLGVAAFGVSSAAARRWLLHPSTLPPVDHRLLLLRTFGQRHRSERLLLDVGRNWRYLGSVQLIAGPDLATASVEPHEFLEFVQRRLARRFVRDRADLDQRLAARDRGRDPDGRFRLEEYFCHDDTWRMTVQRLAADSAVVLLDLRGFAGQHRGVAYELATMVEIYPLQQVVLAVDASTDASVVAAVVENAVRTMPASSPNHALEVLELRVLRLDDPPRGDDPYLAALCAAAAAGLATPVPSRPDSTWPTERVQPGLPW